MEVTHMTWWPCEREHSACGFSERWADLKACQCWSYTLPSSFLIPHHIILHLAWGRVQHFPQMNANLLEWEMKKCWPINNNHYKQKLYYRMIHLFSGTKGWRPYCIKDVKWFSYPPTKWLRLLINGLVSCELFKMWFSFFCCLQAW